MVPLIKSSVSVEEEARTREESVDMDAESTRMTTTPIKKVGERGEHRGNDGVVTAGREIDLIGKETAETAEEIAAARDDQRKQGRNDRPFGDGLLFNGIELLHHLR